MTDPTKPHISVLADRWRAIAPASWDTAATAAGLSVPYAVASRVLRRGTQLGYWHCHTHRDEWKPGPRVRRDPLALRKLVHAWVTEHPRVTAAQIAEGTGLGLRAVSNVCTVLLRCDALRSHPQRGTCAYRYSALPWSTEGSRTRRQLREKSARAKKHAAEEALLLHLTRAGEVDTGSLAEAMGLTPRQVRRVIARVRMRESVAVREPAVTRKVRAAELKAERLRLIGKAEAAGHRTGMEIAAVTKISEDTVQKLRRERDRANGVLPTPKRANGKVATRLRLEAASVRSLVERGITDPAALQERTGLSRRRVKAILAELPPELTTPREPRKLHAPASPTLVFLRALLAEPWSTLDELPPCPGLDDLLKLGLITTGKGGALCATASARALIAS